MSLKSEKIDNAPPKIDKKSSGDKSKIDNAPPKIEGDKPITLPKIEGDKSKIDNAPPKIEGDKPITPPKIEGDKSKIDKKKSSYIKKGYNPNSKENLQVKSKKIEEKSNVSFPKNSNFMLYLGIVVGVIAVTTGVYFAYSYLKNKKSKKIEEPKSQETNSTLPDLNNLTNEELEKLKKISDAMENFED